MAEGDLLAADRGRLLLAVETATRIMSVAVLRGVVPLAEITDEGSGPHSERLLPGIDRALRRAGIGLAEIEAFAVSLGPGSFTGLRVGLATVKGFALGDTRPVVGVPTLAALAAVREDRPGPVVALLDARRGEVYAAGWSSPTVLEAEASLAESVYGPESLAAALAESPCTLVVGEGAEEVAGQVAGLAGARVAGLEPAPASALRVGRLGARLLAAGAGRDAAELLPRYVRRAEAEVRRTGARFEAEPVEPL